MTIALLACGCSHRPEERQPEYSPQVESQLDKEKIDQAKLYAEIGTLLRGAYVRLIGAAEEVTTGTDSPTTVVAALRLKIWTGSTIDSLLTDPDPRRAFVGTWLLLHVMKNNLTGGDLKTAFGDSAETMLTVVNDLITELESIGNETFGSDLMAEVKPEIEALAEQRVIAAATAIHIAAPHKKSGAGDGKLIAGILSAPMSPFTAMEGVGSAPQEINRMTAATLATMNRLPTQLRWEIEALLPSVRMEAEALIASINDSQSGLQQTLNDAEQVVERVDKAIQDADTVVTHVGDVVKEVDRISLQVNDAMKTFDEAGMAWGETATEVNKVIEGVNKLAAPDPNKPPPDPNAPPGPGPADYIKMAEDIRDAATQINDAIGRLESAQMTTATSNVEKMAQSTITDASDEASKLVDKITVRAIIVIVVFVALLFVYRLLTRRLVKA